MIKISVIVPVYNVELYLEECLDSLKNQIFNEFEVIAINDGSTDNSLDILEKYKSEFTNLHIINQKNMGLSAARNAGIDVARGEYIIFLDSDDMLEENALKDVYSLAIREDLDMVTFEALRFDDISKKVYSKVSERENIYKKEIMSIDEYLEGALKKCLLMSTLHFYKTNIIKENNVLFKVGLLHEDELHSLTMYRYLKKVGYLNKQIYLRRFRENSIMTGDIYKNEKSLESYIYILKMINSSEEIKKYNKNLSNLIKNRSSLLLTNLIRYNKFSTIKMIKLSRENKIRILFVRYFYNLLKYKILADL